MLLNIPIRADGTLDETATGILEDLGEWFDVNGEGIYATRPWYMYGEGKTEMPHKTIESPFTFKDLRYTSKGEFLRLCRRERFGKGTVFGFPKSRSCAHAWMWPEQAGIVKLHARLPATHALNGRADPPRGLTTNMSHDAFPCLVESRWVLGTPVLSLSAGVV